LPLAPRQASSQSPGFNGFVGQGGWVLASRSDDPSGLRRFRR
jgi:hypothetical protein